MPGVPGRATAVQVAAAVRRAPDAVVAGRQDLAPLLRPAARSRVPCRRRAPLRPGDATVGRDVEAAGRRGEQVVAVRADPRPGRRSPGRRRARCTAWSRSSRHSSTEDAGAEPRPPVALAGAAIDDCRIARVERDRADRERGRVVGARCPAAAPVAALPHAAVCRAHSTCAGLPGSTAIAATRPETLTRLEPYVWPFGIVHGPSERHCGPVAVGGAPKNVGGDLQVELPICSMSSAEEAALRVVVLRARDLVVYCRRPPRRPPRSGRPWREMRPQPRRRQRAPPLGRRARLGAVEELRQP